MHAHAPTAGVARVGPGPWNPHEPILPPQLTRGCPRPAWPRSRPFHAWWCHRTAKGHHHHDRPLSAHTLNRIFLRASSQAAQQPQSAGAPPLSAPRPPARPERQHTRAGVRNERWHAQKNPRWGVVPHLRSLQPGAKPTGPHVQPAARHGRRAAAPRPATTPPATHASSTRAPQLASCCLRPAPPAAPRLPAGGTCACPASASSGITPSGARQRPSSPLARPLPGAACRFQRCTYEGGRRVQTGGGTASCRRSRWRFWPVLSCRIREAVGAVGGVRGSGIRPPFMR